jgi:hypothetical protein
VKLKITQSFDLKTERKAFLIEQFTYSIENIINDKNYGESIEFLFIEFNCISLNKSFATGLVVGYDYFKKSKTLEISVKINDKELRKSDSNNFHIIGIKALSSVLDYIKINPIKNFNVNEFISDFNHELGKIDFFTKKIEELFISPMPLPTNYTYYKSEEIKKISSDQRNILLSILENKENRFKFFEEKLKRLEEKLNIQHNEKIKIRLHFEEFMFFFIEKLKSEESFSVIKEQLAEYIEEVQFMNLDTEETEILEDIMSDYIEILSE